MIKVIARPLPGQASEDLLIEVPHAQALFTIDPSVYSRMIARIPDDKTFLDIIDSPPQEDAAAMRAKFYIGTPIYFWAPERYDPDGGGWRAIFVSKNVVGKLNAPEMPMPPLIGKSR